jgi:phospholipid/cholesterol/gamma-HCH transport system ATP-binding protein
LGVALPAIELREVSVSFNDQVILEKVSFSVFLGETVVLIGPSGHGKSTLMKVMAGLVRPQRGDVLVEGENIYAVSVARRQELMCKMGMLFQKNALFDSLSNGENIAFPLREVTDYSEEQINQIVDQFLQAVGIHTAKHLFPDEISGGMQKRLGIARALSLNPQLIFYDDPTAGLDPITSRKIIDLILELKKKNNSTVIAITNEMNRAYQMADRIAMVVDRDLIITGNVAETMNSKDPRIHQFVHGDLTGPLTGTE